MQKYLFLTTEPFYILQIFLRVRLAMPIRYLAVLAGCYSEPYAWHHELLIKDSEVHGTCVAYTIVIVAHINLTFHYF